MNKDEFIKYLTQQYIEKQKDSSLNEFNSKLNKLNNYGNMLSKSGEYLKGFDNKFAKTIGNKMGSAGDFITDKTSTIQNFTNPSNYLNGITTQSNPELTTKALDSVLGQSGTTAGVSAGAGTTASATAGTTASAGAGAGASSMAGPLVALAIMALKGTNRKGSKKVGEALMNSSSQQGQDIANQTESMNEQSSMPDYASQILEDSTNNLAQTNFATKPVNNTNYNGPTGYASNLTDLQIQKLVDKENAEEEKQNAIPNIRVVPNENGGVDPVITQNVKINNNGTIKDRLIDGLADFKRGFDENYNNGFEIGNLANNRINTTKNVDYEFNPESEDLQKYIKDLANKHAEQKVIDAVKIGNNGGDKNVDEWLKQNHDKVYNKEVVTYDTKDKGKMNRVGEAVGSVTRWAKNPNVQGLVAGTVGTLLTGNPLYGVGLGYKIAGNRQVSDIYTKALKNQGIDVDTGLTGNIDNKDFNSLYTPKGKELDRQIQADRLAQTIAYQNAKLLEMANHNREMEQIGKINANANVIRANKGGNGKGGKKTSHKGLTVQEKNYIRKIQKEKYPNAPFEVLVEAYKRGKI